MTHHQPDEPLPAISAAPLDTLFVAAHPDDVLHVCGTLMRDADAGARVGLLVLSCGGGVPDVLGVGERELAGVRCAEVLAAGRLIGVKYVRVLRHEDARPDRRRATPPGRGRGFIGGLQDHLHSLTEEVLGELIRHRPRNIVTFGPDGLDGHPDHVAAHHATLAALAARPDRDAVRLSYLTSERPNHADVGGHWRPATRRVDTVALTHRKLRVCSVFRSQALTVLDAVLAQPERTLQGEDFHDVTDTPDPAPRRVSAEFPGN